MEFIKGFHSPPRTLAERENLYGRIRKLALWLDRIPGIPAPIGLDAIIGFVPVVGDFIGLIASLYQVFLAHLFGIPTYLLFRMLINVLIDFAVGLLPWVGDMLDILYTGNIYNLTLLERWLTENSLVDVPRYKMEHPMGEGASYDAQQRRTRAAAAAAAGRQSRGYY